MSFKTSSKIEKAIRKIPSSQLEDFYDTLWELADATFGDTTHVGIKEVDYIFAKFDRGVALGRKAGERDIYQINTGGGYYAYFIGTEDEVIATLKDIGLPEIS